MVSTGERRGSRQSSRRIPPQQHLDKLARRREQYHRKKLLHGEGSSRSNILHMSKLEKKCTYCGAKKFKSEPNTFCCYNGNVKLFIPEMPEELYKLYTSQSLESDNFRRYVRGYNNAFAFTSMSANYDENLANMRSGVYTFKVHGQMHHFVPSLVPIDNRPKFLQLYFYDTEHEIENRLSYLPDLLPSTMAILVKIMGCNPYAAFLRRLSSIGPLENYSILIRKQCEQDQRVYNSPTVSQVAAVWLEGNDNIENYRRDIIVHGISGKTYSVKSYYGCYDPLQYPLLFPWGSTGWHHGIPRNMKNQSNSIEFDLPFRDIASTTSFEEVINHEEDVVEKQDRDISCREYYAYMFQIRDNKPNHVLYTGRLFQQYAVDIYIKIETTRLHFHYKSQSKIRPELYQGIQDSVIAGETDASKVGKRIVLPASFIGGPRDMRRRYLDAMALVQRFGKPDIFLTVTCNPEWEEITSELMPWEKPFDRPDLTTRLFHAKIEELKKQLFEKNIFGQVVARVHVIEFQKRGLPHAHFLIIMAAKDKILSPDQYDKSISAEIPDPNKEPLLYERVVKHMMHGPCGNLRPNCPCMRNGRCKHHYPKAFSEATIQGDDTFSIYRRQNNGRTIHVRNADLDNRWVVPYNAFLLLRLNCHINIEICSTIKAVKYLYKYIYKGHDRVAASISFKDANGVIDEIKNYRDARWVSPPEAMWRIYEFHLNEIYPSVTNLQLHLPNEHSVSYMSGANLTQVLISPSAKKTTLTEYFLMNSIDEEARRYLYHEFPEHYVWIKDIKMWQKRKNKRAIGRLNAAHPAEGERYYLRLLLNHVRGATSFDDLKFVEGKQCVTYKESAQRRGIIEEDEGILQCILESATYCMPFALRRLFATILVYCEAIDVRTLWEKSITSMAEDFMHANIISPQILQNSVLQDIRDILESMGKKLEEYDLPNISDSFTSSVGKMKETFEELSVQIPTEDMEAIGLLNIDQKAAFDSILDTINKGNSGVYFIDGPGGTGKTFLYRVLLAKVRSSGSIAIATASSGVVASILPGGRTAHSRFKIPIDLTPFAICNIGKQSGLAELLRNTKLIIWDEAPMCKRYAFEAFDRTLQDIMEIYEPFGGKVIVFGDDFRQVVPVVPRATREEVVSNCLVKSKLWPKMLKFKLKHNMRARDDEEFSQYLMRIGDGTEPSDVNDNVRIPHDMLIEFDCDETSRSKLIDFIFPCLNSSIFSSNDMSTRAILATRNDFVDGLNADIISRFEGDEVVYYSYDNAIDDTNNYYQPEFLNCLTPNGLPPHKLTLKSFCPVMLLRNLDPANGLSNGTRLICQKFHKNAICAKIAMGQHSGKKVLLPRIPLCPAENDDFPFKFKRKQFPIRLAFAMTINKAQGQTIPIVGIYLPQPVFSHGQLYVALSRGTSKQCTKLVIKAESSKAQDQGITKNVVFRELLEDDTIF